MTIEEVTARYPECRRVFHRYGVSAFEGPEVPRKPILFFAADHNITPKQLITELNEAIKRRKLREKRWLYRCIYSIRRIWPSRGIEKLRKAG